MQGEVASVGAVAFLLELTGRVARHASLRKVLGGFPGGSVVLTGQDV